jgi:adenylosuccinate synthase
MDEEGEKMRKQGNEFGSTTGRPRRCGWIDLPSLKYSIMINGVTQLLMMKADVLSIFPVIKICTHYKLSDGTITETLPYEIVNQKITPVYTELPGWNTPLSGTVESGLPSKLMDYVTFLEKALKVPISMISIGPDRSQTVLRPKLG